MALYQEVTRSNLFLPQVFQFQPESLDKRKLSVARAGELNRFHILVTISPEALASDSRVSHEAEEPIPIQNAQAIVLAGGIASRMHTSSPKQLISVTDADKLIDFPMLMLAEAGVESITVSCVRQTVDPIYRHIRGFGESRVVYGTAKFSVKDEAEGVIPAIRQPIDEYGKDGVPLIIAHGDEILFTNVTDMYRSHREKGHPITICMVDHPLAKNKVFLSKDDNSRITQVARYPEDTGSLVAKKDGYDYVLTGLWIVDPDYIDLLKNAEGADEFIFEACRNGLLYGYSSSQLFVNCNLPEDIAMARRLLGGQD